MAFFFWMLAVGLVVCAALIAIKQAEKPMEGDNDPYFDHPDNLTWRDDDDQR